MKAIQCIEYGLPAKLIYREIESQQPQANEVLIDVNACGINFPDVLMIQNKYQLKPPLPFSPGGEVSGKISSVGANIKHLKSGDHVMALSGWGGFAQQITVKENRVFSIPSSIDFVTAASALYTYGTSYNALKDRANLKAGETILVLGAGGGVGLAAVELSKLMGATVIAAAASPDKLAVCHQKGADYLIDYSLADLRAKIKEITNGKGVDVVYDAVGGQLADSALRSMAWKGRYLVVGFASGMIPQFPANLPLLKGCSIVGVFWGSFSEREPEQNLNNTQELMRWLEAGKIKQHIHKLYSLKEAPIALQDLLDRKIIGKAVVVI